MLCSTAREGYECIFMTKKGCSYIGSTCYPAVESCDGCDRIIAIDEMFYCKTYPNPASKWRHNACNFATHIKEELKESTSKINPLKASKRAAAKK